MPYKDKEQQREYQRQWMAKRRAEYFDGKKCIECNTRENLELDHIDRTKKVTHAIWSWSEKRRSEELAKCQILCYDCHKKKTRSESIAKEHGTYAMRNHHGCKCDVCVAYVRNDKRRRRAKGLRN